MKLENDVLSLSFSSKGAALSRAELKKYYTQYSPDETKKVKNPVVLFEGASNNLSFILPVGNEVSTSDLYFDVLAQDKNSVLFGLRFADDAFWGIRYTIKPGDDYVVGIAIEQQGMDKGPRLQRGRAWGAMEPGAPPPGTGQDVRGAQLRPLLQV